MAFVHLAVGVADHEDADVCNWDRAYGLPNGRRDAMVGKELFAR